MRANSIDEKEIFNVAIAIEVDDARQQYLKQVCGDDADLMRRVDVLLRMQREEPDFLDSPVLGGSETVAGQSVSEQTGDSIGPYRLREKIGEGGFGVVYVAEQKKPVSRKVALKVIKPGMDSKDIIARFEAERQALAMMDHPNVAKVHDAGATESGRPYFAMELVHGTSITKFCDEQKLTNRQRLELFVDVCDAVQHAHQKGIIHRDLKPTNVMVTTSGDRIIPKVIDFGVAKALHHELTDKSIYTAYGQLVGTPMYMSPEQAQMSSLDVDTRSDIYSLGVLLYELLTGATPFDKETFKQAGFDEMRRIIREDEPRRPSDRVSTLNAELQSTVSEKRNIDQRSLSRSLRGELDWIVLKAMEKDRSRRYETANVLAADVKRYLSNEPVDACPPTVRYRFSKFARRNKGRLVTTGLLAAAVLVGAGGVGWAVRDRLAHQAKVEREKTERQERVATQVELFMSDVDRLMDNQQWDEALATTQRANAVMAGHESVGTVSQRVQTALEELKFVLRLTDIRMEMSVWKNENYDFDNAAARQSYGRAFREFGIDVETLPVTTAVAQLKHHPRIIIPVATALDNFVYAQRRTSGDDEAGWHSLVELARGIDPDPVRDQMRATWGNNVTPELLASMRKLADSFDAREHSPSTAVSLSRSLRRLQLVKLPEQILRQAQQIYPGDFWVNTDLGAL